MRKQIDIPEGKVLEDLHTLALRSKLKLKPYMEKVLIDHSNKLKN